MSQSVFIELSLSMMFSKSFRLSLQGSGLSHKIMGDTLTLSHCLFVKIIPFVLDFSGLGFVENLRLWSLAKFSQIVTMAWRPGLLADNRNISSAYGTH